MTRKKSKVKALALAVMCAILAGGVQWCWYGVCGGSNF